MLTLGLEDDLDHLANPDTDSTGNLLDKQNHDQKQRVRTPRKTDMDF